MWSRRNTAAGASGVGDVMASKPKQLSGTAWALEVDGNEQAKLVGLPGLRVTQGGRRVEGSVDAIGAAAYRLGQEVPELPEPTPYSLDQLYAFQNYGAAWVVDRLKAQGGALLADEMGLGKTRQAIAAAQKLTQGGGRVFIVGPAYLRSPWRTELERMGETSVAACVPKGTKGFKEEWEAAPTAKWVVSSYELAARAYKAAFLRSAPRVLLMDEAQLLRGRNAKRSKILEDVRAVCPYRLAITGTPAWSRPRDYFQILKLLFGQRFGSQYDFDRAYAGATENSYGGLVNTGATNLEELRLRIGYYMLRRLKKDVAKDLPELTRQVIWLDADKHATMAFHEALTARSGGATHAALEATLAHKVDAALDLASQAKQFLLFTWLKASAGEMWQRLNEELETPCELITGDVPADKRQAILDRAAAAGHGVVATIDSMQAGVNAQHVASVGIFHAIDYTHSKILQAEARIHRIGSGKPVQWTYLALRDSYDELVVKTVVEKLDAHRAVLGDGKEMRDTFDDTLSGGQSEADYLKALYEAAT
jgi:SNF2 family DNA or RNA helicase